MTGREKVCPKCGDSCSPAAQFCGSCGYRFDEKSSGDLARKVQETVRSAESAARTAESAVRTATKVRDLVITPPVEWKVVVGDRLPEALAAKATAAVQGKAADLVAEKAKEGLERVIFTTAKSIDTPAPALPSPEPAGERCTSCGAPLRPGVKFCGACGAANVPPVKKVVVKPAAKPAQPDPEGERCGSCGASLKPGVKFCGSCGAAVTTPVKAIPVSGQCASCGAVLKPGVKFCGSCGAKVPVP
ncbi:MAG: zinc ribbon domain-containing protein [Methanoregulaceae archaeon]|jgi:predicted amidophosphoribosyltransferase|nr:zinc ribbon domain-containing protein [Methanoregulaceae archaeon]HNL86632.1 zinc-ribbon domain-containing protein [Methanoregulaceae archaeon]HOU80505.1 zinc-ribbon domain-containing protein [Methanoregulaceae archaeon]